MTNVFGIGPQERKVFDPDQVRRLLRQLPDQELIELSQESEAEAEPRILTMLETRGAEDNVSLARPGGGIGRNLVTP